MPEPLTDEQKQALSKLEALLRDACKRQDLEEAKSIIIELQRAFLEARGHFRILRAKNWYFEALLNSGKTDDAQAGFETIIQRANEGTRIYLEARAFLGICLLRKQLFEASKVHIEYVVHHISHIKSERRRTQFERRLLTRIQDECVLSQLIGTDRIPLDVDEIHRLSVEWVKKSEEEILDLVGQALPGPTQLVLKDMTDYSIKLMPPQDRKLLEAPKSDPPKRELGQKALAALKRIGWGTFCDEGSGIYKLWSNGVPRVFNEGYFASAAIAALAEWKIGLPQIAVGLAATAMRYTCKDFCERFRPESLMIGLEDKG